MVNEASSKKRYVLQTGLNFDQKEENGKMVPNFYPAGSVWTVPDSHQRWNDRAHCLVNVPYTPAEQEALVAELLASGTIREYGSQPSEAIAAQQSEIERLTRQLEEQQAMIEKLELEQLKQRMGVPASLGSGGTR